MRQFLAISLSLILIMGVTASFKNGEIVDRVFAGTKEQIKRGRGKAQLCTRCHGGKGMLHAAIIAKWEGTVESFIIKQLKDFRSGQRTNEIMNSLAAPLTDDDIAEIAAWYHAISNVK